LSVGNRLFGSPGGNRIYHNNFVNNTVQVCVGSANFWDDGYPSGGNFFSDYTGADNYSGVNQDEPGCDGIGDAPYVIKWSGGGPVSYYGGWAHYPLMMLWTTTPTKTFVLNVTSTCYRVVFNTNSTITHFQLNNTDPSNPRLVFNASGTSGTTGYCNITIPKTLIKAEPSEVWIIEVNGTIIYRTISENATHTLISFTYTYHSPVKVEIIGTWAVTENQTPLVLMALILILTILASTLTKKYKKHQDS
jgi:hypothetical protein